MKTLVISQLVQAVLVIVVTIITVRYTQLGSLGISEKFKARFKTRLKTSSLIVFIAVFPVLVAVLIAWNIRRLVFKEGLPSRLDVFDIAFNVVIFYYWTSAGIKDWGNVWDGYWATRDKTGLKQPPDHQS